MSSTSLIVISEKEVYHGCQYYNQAPTPRSQYSKGDHRWHGFYPQTQALGERHGTSSADGKDYIEVKAAF